MIDQNLGLKGLFFFVVLGLSHVVVYMMAIRNLHGC